MGVNVANVPEQMVALSAVICTVIMVVSINVHDLKKSTGVTLTPATAFNPLSCP